jgi:NitT/TauT family transport system substrate-binding protein
MRVSAASARTFSLTCAAAIALLCPGPSAAADDALTIVTGAQPTAFYQVIDDVAMQAGFFKEQHLAVDYNYAGNPTIASQLLASGKGDIGAQALEPLITGYQRGVHLQVFFMRTPKSQYALGVRDDSPIRTLEDFKGTILGEYSTGSSAEDYVNSMLQGAGVRRADYSYIPIGNGAQAIEALNTNKVAGAAFPYLELLLYEVNAGQKYRFFFNPLLEDVPDTGYTATPATIQTKGDLLKRFCRAVAEASVLIRVNPVLAARYYLQVAGQPLSDDAIQKEAHLLQVAQGLLPGADPLSKRIGNVPIAGMATLSQVMYANGDTAALVPVSAIATDQFLDFANDFDHRALMARAKQMH